MNQWEMVDAQFHRLDYLFQEGMISDLMYDALCKQLTDSFQFLARTTEDASQTDRGGEQPCEVGLVQPTDNAGATPDLDMGIQRIELMDNGGETNEGHVSSALHPFFEDDQELHDQDRPY